MRPQPLLVDPAHFERLYHQLAGVGIDSAEGADLLRDLSACHRINALAAIVAAQHGWVGATFSCAEILTVLYARAALTAGRAGLHPPVVALGKGHAAPMQYAALAGCGLIPTEDLLRYKRPDGPQAHADRRTPGIPLNSGSLGQTLSKCCGLALASPATVFAILGDGELQEGQCWEALMTASQRRLANLVVIIDRNGIQSDSAVDDVKAIPDLEGALAAFGFDVRPIDGNDVRAVNACLSGLEPARRPTVIVADTRKGAGVSFMEARTVARRGYEWHGRVPDDGEYDAALAELGRGMRDAAVRAAVEGQLSSRPAALRASHTPAATPVDRDAATGSAFAAALVALAERHAHVVALDADLEKPCRLADFARRFPERYYEMGIAEQDMVSCAGGLALAGRLPVVNTYAAFFRRALDQVQLNASERTRIVYAGHYAGLCYTTDGATHTSTGDVALMRSIPGMIVLHPAVSTQLAQILEWYVTSGGARPLYLRLHRTPAARVRGLDPPAFRLGRGWTARDVGGRTAVVTSGPHLTAFCCHAADELLAGSGPPVDVVSLATLRPLDAFYARELALRYERLAVIEEVFDAGGLLDELAHALAAVALEDRSVRSPELLHLAVDDFTPSTREPQGLYARFGLDTSGILEFLRAAAAT